MKIRVIIDAEREEEILVYSHQENELVKRIKLLVENSDSQLTGYMDREAVKINPEEICLFTAQGNKVFAITEKGSYRIKEKLYQMEEKYSDLFVRINQSCLANTEKIEKFDVSFSGTMKVIFKNGYTDYVSRRNLKYVKERFGI